MIKKIILFVLIFPTIWVANLCAQNDYYDFESFSQFSPINLIDKPTANILTEESERDEKPPKYFHLSLRVYNLGGMIGGITVGLTRHLMFGVSYGGQNVIGEGNVEWNQSPGIQIRYKLISETYPFPPAISIGYNSQGYGAYLPTEKRYEIKSTGLYLVASKNYSNVMLNLGFHGGFNFSPENKGGDKDLNIFMGAHLIMEDELALIWEYDLATNDNDEHSLGSGKGYMNAAVRWLFANRLILEFSVKNFLRNKKDPENTNGEAIPHSNRELKIIYRQHL